MTPALARMEINWAELQRAAISAFITSRDNGSFARDRSAPELNTAARLLYPASGRTCRECGAPFDASAVTSALFCAACITGWDQPNLEVS